MMVSKGNNIDGKNVQRSEENSLKESHGKQGESLEMDSEILAKIYKLLDTPSTSLSKDNQGLNREGVDSQQLLETVHEANAGKKEVSFVFNEVNKVTQSADENFEDLEKKVSSGKENAPYGPLDKSKAVFTQVPDSNKATTISQGVKHGSQATDISQGESQNSARHVNEIKKGAHFSPLSAEHATAMKHVNNVGGSSNFLCHHREGTTHPNFAENLGLKTDPHVTCTPTPLTFLEAAKLNMKDSTREIPPQESKSCSLLNYSQFPDLDNNGGARVIVSPEILNRRKEVCKFSIIGRVILAKGEEAWTTKKLRERLNEVWNFGSAWRLISLGKGFFHILLTSEEELEKVWKRGVINIKPGVMRFQKWVFGLDPLKEKSSNAQVWFRFYNLPWCLWDSTILAALSKKIGSPIRFDNNTLYGDFGHYARILIEVDLSKEIKSVLQLDCGKDIFDVKVVPENIPLFCKACSNIGHHSTECRSIGRKVEIKKATEIADLAIQDRLDAHKNKGKGKYGALHASQQSEENSEGNHKGKDIEEMAPVFGSKSPRVSPSKGDKGLHMSNKFTILDDKENKEENEDGTENIIDQNSYIDEVKKNDKEQRVTREEEEVNHRLSDIRKWAEQEKRKMRPPAENKKKWSDMVEEEEEGCHAKSTPKASKQTDILFYERHGERAELQISTGIVRFSPIPNKNKEK